MTDEWIEKDGLLYYTNRLYIRKAESLQTERAQGCHDSLVVGHFGQENPIEIVIKDFYWKGLAVWIRDYVRWCNECQHTKSRGMQNMGNSNCWRSLMLPGALVRRTSSRKYGNRRGRLR